MVSNWEVFCRLGLITLLAGLIGLEREYYKKPAGLRTNVMVGLGSALITIASLSAVTMKGGVQVDPTRITAQVVSGIGFIGAGVILRPSSGNGAVIGLTTAATLWLVSGLGIAIGMGFYFEAIASTGFVFFTFFVLSRVVNKLRRHLKDHPPKYEHDDDAKVIEAKDD